MIKGVAVLGLLVLGWWYFAAKSQAPEPRATPLPSPESFLSQNESKLWQFQTDYGDFRAAWEVVPVNAEVQVGINSNLELSSQQIMDEYGCRVLTSAAFYGSDNRPIGLLMDQGSTLSAWQENQLLNGILIGNQDKVKIGKTSESMDWAVQAGPVVWQKQSPVKLNLTADQIARRVVAAVTDAGQLVLIVIVADDSLYGGPNLADLPQILAAWQNQSGIVLADALNLDGGTASAFLSPTLKLRELKPIGSFFCIY